MSDAILATPALLFAYAGCAGYGLAMERHRDHAFARPPGARGVTALRALGTLCLVLSAAACIHAWGGPIGCVAWFAVVTAAAIAFTGLLRYHTVLARRLTWLTPAVALAVFGATQWLNGA
ncbi:DUF3325 domain-containing protein [Robbsia sp. Bb-Pol-6]|uniref:DUF3325 domain-containing protein n=1 Tax=Robbsia betulipollinis TaxID=2981849 RepID=A0ABT3ZHP8_9BURK|nr:DUF3325 domain-containing protein [Robbsia betulipollinis]MCY0386049.1 DUF3325 domain-containing protein [Robbsia betulipollinis]